MKRLFVCLKTSATAPTGETENTKFITKQQKITIDRYKYDISNDILNGKIQLDEVEKALGRIRKGKAFNTILASTNYPDDWALGLIYPVHKKGDKSNPQSYGNVSLIISCEIILICALK